eukprot:GEMP01001864.1.p1 GENE.GEMP01001864.1~~GEMP01001864.1.p1  ORF type:complete len:819 (+),score=183.47 GEMP01001864.1:290-2746(+)
MGRGALLPMQRGDANVQKVTFTTNKRWEAFHGDNKEVFYGLHGGRMGLRNLCNTCFMNAGLQCLAHVEPVAAYFLTSKYKQEINATNPLGTGGKLATAFAQFLKQIWRPPDKSSSSKPLSPKQMHKALERFAPHLMEGYEQQDAQEFLAYMLDGLSEDLNLVKERPPPEKMSEEEEEKMYMDLEEKHGEEFVAALHWKKYLTRNKSFLVDIFQGQLRSVLTCTECGYSSKTFDPYLYLSLPVSSSMTCVADALHTFLEEEQLDGDNRWRCNRCKKKVVAKKKMDIYKAPSVLILHLKRFSFNYETGVTTKVSTFLDMPLTLDLSSYIVSHHKDSLTYDVIGVANHTGPHGFGHYTATCKHPIDNNYYHFDDDDEVVRLDDLNDMITEGAYVLFLLRHAKQSDPLRRQTITLPDVWPHWVSKKDSQIVPIKERILPESETDEEATPISSMPSVTTELGKPIDPSPRESKLKRALNRMKKTDRMPPPLSPTKSASSDSNIEGRALSGKADGEKADGLKKGDKKHPLKTANSELDVASESLLLDADVPEICRINSSTSSKRQPTGAFKNWSLRPRRKADKIPKEVKTSVSSDMASPHQVATPSTLQLAAAEAGSKASSSSSLPGIPDQHLALSVRSNVLHPSGSPSSRMRTPPDKAHLKSEYAGNVSEPPRSRERLRTGSTECETKEQSSAHNDDHADDARKIDDGSTPNSDAGGHRGAPSSHAKRKRGKLDRRGRSDESGARPDAVNPGASGFKTRRPRSAPNSSSTLDHIELNGHASANIPSSEVSPSRETRQVDRVKSRKGSGTRKGLSRDILPELSV